MAELVRVGQSYRNYQHIPGITYKKAVEANLSYDWEEEFCEGSNAEEGVFPKLFRCPQTGIRVIQIHKDDAVKLCVGGVDGGKILTFTLEQRLNK